MENMNKSTHRVDAPPTRRIGKLGVSYLELTAALFVFTLGVLGSFQMFHVSLTKMHAVKEDDIALRAIQNEIETLRSTSFDDVLDGDHAFRSTTPELAQLVNAQPRVLVETPSPAPAGLKKVEASVAWTGENGRTITKTVTTLIADKGFRP